jgi:hypothetical protein
MKNFNYSKFTEWRQDNKDYSAVNTPEEYVARIGQDIIEYCIKYVGTTPHTAYSLSDKYFQIECHRLGIELIK